eukprot:3925332-Rhodomonas_salina.1
MLEDWTATFARNLVPFPPPALRVPCAYPGSDARLYGSQAPHSNAFGAGVGGVAGVAFSDSRRHTPGHCRFPPSPMQSPVLALA